MRETAELRYAARSVLTPALRARAELIDDPDVDVVYNPASVCDCTERHGPRLTRLTRLLQLPNGLHYEWTWKALSAGKHVLVEKPMSDTSAEAAALVAFAAEKSLVLLEAIHHRRVRPLRRRAWQ